MPSLEEKAERPRTPNAPDLGTIPDTGSVWGSRLAHESVDQDAFVQDPRDFDLDALYVALDAQRARRGLTWRGVADEINARFSGSRASGVSPSTISGVAKKKNGVEGDGVCRCSCGWSALPKASCRSRAGGLVLMRRSRWSVATESFGGTLPLCTALSLQSGPSLA